MRLSLVLGLVYLASEILLTITRRGRSKAGEKQDRSTLRVIWIVILISIGTAVFVAGNFRAGTLPYAELFAAVGVVLFALGLVLRWWAIMTLGRFFTVDVVVEKDHEVVERGPFRWVRHPSYTGVLLAFVGCGTHVGELGGDGGGPGADLRGVYSSNECGGASVTRRVGATIRGLHEKDA